MKTFGWVFFWTCVLLVCLIIFLTIEIDSLREEIEDCRAGTDFWYVHYEMLSNELDERTSELESEVNAEREACVTWVRNAIYGCENSLKFEPESDPLSCMRNSSDWIEENLEAWSRWRRDNK